MSSNAGTGVDDEVQQKFSQLKKSTGGLKWLVFRLTDASFKEHTVIYEKEWEKEKTNPNWANGWTVEDELSSWTELCKFLQAATIKTRRGKVIPGPRYAVFDFEYEVGAGEGMRKKVALIDWCPDSMDIYWRTIHPASLPPLKTTLGISDSLQIKDEDLMIYKHALLEVDKRADVDALPSELPEELKKSEGA